MMESMIVMETVHLLLLRRLELGGIADDSAVFSRGDLSPPASDMAVRDLLDTSITRDKKQDCCPISAYNNE